MKDKATTIALIVAAGRGVRAGGEVPKQYQLVNGVPLIRKTVLQFLNHDKVDHILVVWNKADKALYEKALGDLPLLDPIQGGENRQQSVYNGLLGIKGLNPEKVLIHDGARCFTAPEVISNVIDAININKSVGAIPALPITDTVKRSTCDEKSIQSTVPQGNLWAAQTPQGFPYVDILSAHEYCKDKALTDDAAVFEEGGMPVKIVLGDDNNIKITTPEDFKRQTKEGKQMEYRTGQGFDVHRFEDGESCMLCGVSVPHSQKLKGHSDADVALHALTDALLGSISAGDIGDHFPPSEARWAGASSDMFIEKAVQLIHEKQGVITHIDLTIICEAPKIGPHKAKMKTRVAEIIGINEDRVSIKATTTEKLGFTGRSEGIAAQAVATVSLPE
jgi:2-C-methyl-D-erythritol 4-phosphate cytidylyltransferase/2-C-methyl-D-erythritol 2,4-cyclodiphosphate synthase